MTLTWNIMFVCVVHQPLLGHSHPGKAKTLIWDISENSGCGPDVHFLIMVLTLGLAPSEHVRNFRFHISCLLTVIREMIYAVTDCAVNNTSDGRVQSWIHSSWPALVCSDGDQHALDYMCSYYNWNLPLIKIRSQNMQAFIAFTLLYFIMTFESIRPCSHTSDYCT